MNLTSKLCLLVVCALPALGFAGVRAGVNTDDGVGVNVGVYNQDRWYGDGYYYGVWFDDEDDYWAWRQRHRYYPANGPYYSRDRRVYWNPRYPRRHYYRYYNN